MHTLKPAKGSQRKRKVLGRGNASGKGTTGGRGGKGQTARTGGRNNLKRIGMRHIIQQTPKLPGFRSLNDKSAIVNLAAINREFGQGEVVSPRTLAKKGLIPANAKIVKILAEGKLQKKLIFVECIVSASAKEKITTNGGEVK